MSYEIRTAIVDPKEGYNKAADKYHHYRKHLDSFDKGVFLRYLPRHLHGIDILDLGAGDGRMYQYFKKVDYNSYTACDIADKLLAKHPKGPKITTTVCNLEEPLPYEDSSFDLVMSFFVLEHIANLDELFAEVDRTMKPGGTWVIGHFKQRRAFEYKVEGEKFKVNRYTYHRDDIKKLAEYYFFKFYEEEIFEDGISIGYVFALIKP